MQRRITNILVTRIYGPVNTQKDVGNIGEKYLIYKCGGGNLNADMSWKKNGATKC